MDVVKDLMRVHYKNKITVKEIWLFLWHAKQDNKVNPPKSLKISINIMINIIFKEECMLHLSYKKNGLT